MKYKIKNFFSTEFWKKKISQSKGLLRIVYTFFYLLLHALKSFSKENGFLHTANLTYYSILSVVPIIAMGFAIAKGFGMEEYLNAFVSNPNLQNKEIWQKVIEFAHVWLSRTKGGLVAGVGIFVLLYSVLSMLQNIEEAFNEIWKVITHRTLIRKLTDYTTIILLFPILLLVSFGITVFIQNKIVDDSHKNAWVNEIGLFAADILQLFPFVLISIVFCLLYTIITNKKIKIGSAFYGAIFAGITFQIFQNVYIHYQVKLTSYNAVYGSFAAIPFFFIWLYYSWSIILLGAHIGMHHENFKLYNTPLNEIELNHDNKKTFAVLIMYEIISNFKNKQTASLSINSLSQKVQLPYLNVLQILQELCRAKLINQIVGNQKEEYLYQPAFDIGHYTILSITEPLDNQYKNEKENNDSTIDFNNPNEKYQELLNRIQNIKQISINSEHNIQLIQLF